MPLPDGAAEHGYGLTSAGPFARDIADAAVMLAVLRGSAAVTPAQAGESSLRIAVSVRHPFLGAPVDAAVSTRVHDVAHRLAGSGHHVAHADPPYPQLPLPFLRCFPAATVPIGRDEDGLPVAVQVVAGVGKERLLLDVAAQAEALSEWPR